MSSPNSDKCRIALVCLWGLCTAVMSHAADLFYMDHDAFTGRYVGPTGALVMSGDIEPGDYQELFKRIGEDPQRFLVQDRLIVASVAGDVHEAMKIARLLQALHTEVSVSPLTGRCAGACFLIYAAADERTVDGAHLLGIRSASPDEANAVRDFLHEQEVPAGLIERAIDSKSVGEYRLEEADETALTARSPAFTRYLVQRCRWRDETEREVRSGKRPMADMKEQWDCRERLIHGEAAAAWAAQAAASRKVQPQ